MQLVFLFRLHLIFQAGDPSFLHTSPGICQLLQVHRVVETLFLKLRGLFRTRVHSRHFRWCESIYRPFYQ